MKRIYLFKKGGKFNPVKTATQWDLFTRIHKNCYMYIKDDGAIAAFLDTWQRMRDNNIIMKIVK